MIKKDKICPLMTTLEATGIRHNKDYVHTFGTPCIKGGCALWINLSGNFEVGCAYALAARKANEHIYEDD